MDVERGEYGAYDDEHDDEHKVNGGTEHEALLSIHKNIDDNDSQLPRLSFIQPRFTIWHLVVAFVVGIGASLGGQYALSKFVCATTANIANANLANPNAGSTQIHNFPPPSPTNIFPSLFPTNVGYAGGTPTGAEPALVATAPSYPMRTSTPELVKGKAKVGVSDSDSDLFKLWGNLSPWYSNKRGTFGLDSGAETPEGCTVDGLHLLHRHGARYPTAWASYGGPADFAKRLHESASTWNAQGELEFLNEWRYKLGEEVLTPFGRQQLFDLGVSMRLKYGFLLERFTEKERVPVFRTESQDRMLNSAINFAIGFFGYPHYDKYQQSITIEADGFNNTLAPYDTCHNARYRPISDRGTWYVERWAERYLNETRERIQGMLEGYEVSVEDVYTMQQMCAYETVSLGFSKFCTLFTQTEWEGFDYSLDLYFWYNSAFGSPVARVQGAGWIRELIARLEHKVLGRTPNEQGFSVNYTLDSDPRTFPVNESLYVDATHEVVVLNILTGLNLSTLAANGPLPYDHIPENQTFKVSQLAPFATNVQFQILDCPSLSSSQTQTQTETQNIRILINDAPVPLTGITDCPPSSHGLCPLRTFVEAQKAGLERVSWEWGCEGDYADVVGVGRDWESVTGDPPPQPRR
ncbi:phosphoglycerate mutase-like protein [Lentinula detonsa]|uniref:Phosphoglycerate mutase-like protein n=1 Tax=Lentinula detonsa TaxID=2804962 RepID=A0A9W8NXE0_9AGAR|nr:phosphoglycerate mutase-like protein [Lentinula detonsa]